MNPPISFNDYVHALLHPPERSRASRTVEWFGWLMLIESPFLLVLPHAFAAFLRVPELSPEGESWVRLSGGLLSVIGMLYIACGRLNSGAFVFTSLLDRPLVPFVMAVLWWRGLIPGVIALGFSIQDFGTFLWTLFTWRSEVRASRPVAMPYSEHVL
jgi:hypothetical protein